MSSLQNTLPEDADEKSSNIVNLEDKANSSDTQECAEKDVTQKSIITGVLASTSSENQNIFSKSDTDLENIDKSSINIDAIPSVEDDNSDKEDDLELKYEDDEMDDDECIENEDALLADDIEMEDDIITIYDLKDNAKFEDKVATSPDVHVMGEKKVTGMEYIDQPPDNLGNINEETQHFDVSLPKDEITSEIVTDQKHELNFHENTPNVDKNKSTFSTSSSLNDSSFEPITDHGLNKPDMMLEIPTQELIEFSDDDDDEECGSKRFRMSPDIEVIDLEENNSTNDNITKKNNTEIDKDATNSGNINIKAQVATDESQTVDGAKSYNTDIVTNILDKQCTNEGNKKPGMNCLNVSPDTDNVIYLVENNSITENLINNKICDTEEQTSNSDNNHEKNSMDHSDTRIGETQAIEFCKDNIDINTNALSYEAEIAADIITKEMNATNDETTEPISNEQNEIESEEMNSEHDICKDPVIVMEQENTDVIDISDDNIDNETDDIHEIGDMNERENIDTNFIKEQNAKVDNELRLAIMEEDILNDVREIDNLILLTDRKPKEVNNINISVKAETCELNVEQSILVNDDIKSYSKCSIKTIAEVKNIFHEIDTSCEKNYSGTDNSNNTKTYSDKTDSEQLSKEESSNIPSNDKIKTVASPTSFTVHETCTLLEASITKPKAFTSVPSSKCNPTLPQEGASEPNIASTLLPASSETDMKQFSTSEVEPHISTITQILTNIETCKTSKKEDIQLSKSNSSIGILETDQIKSSSKIESEIIPQNYVSQDDPQPSTSKLMPDKVDLSIETEQKTKNNDKQSYPIIEKDDSQPPTSQIQNKLRNQNDPKPSTSKIETHIVEPTPSTSKRETEVLNSELNSPKSQDQDTSNDVPEMSDSLGLLAESSRIMEDDEDHDDDDYGEDEDDFDPDDESSNQMTAEHSEDSNAHHSESDAPKDSETPTVEKESFNFTVSEPTSVPGKESGIECDSVNFEEHQEIEDTNKIGDNVAPNNIDKLQTEVKNESVQLSEPSDTKDSEKEQEGGVLKALLLEGLTKTDSENVPSYKTRNLSISKQESVMSFVDLEESSSDDEAGKNEPETKKSETQVPPLDDVVLPLNDVTDTISCDDPSSNEPVEEVKEIETASSSSPKPEPEKEAEPEVTVAEKSPEVAVAEKTEVNTSPPLETEPPVGLQVFSLDSDEDDPSKQSTEPAVAEETPIEQPLRLHEALKCVNRLCTNSDPNVGYYVADTCTVLYYEANKKKRAYVCEKCSDVVEKRNQELVEGIKNFTPLLELHSGRNVEELVEISDSDSDEDLETNLDQVQLVGKEGAKLMEEKLADMLNETWVKYKMDSRIAESQVQLRKELEKLQKESEEIDALFNECQVTTDKLRNSLYATFDPEIQELPSIVIYDTPNCSYSCLEPGNNEHRQHKRRLSPSKEIETPAKKPVPALPLETKIEQPPKLEQEPKTTIVDDDNTDVAVVKLSAEAAPADLPPPGEIAHPPIKVGMTVYAMKNAFGTWLRAKVVEIQAKTHTLPFTMCRVRFEHKVTKNPFKTLPARCLAYFEPPEVRMTIGTRVIALFKDRSARNAYYSGIVAEIPNPVNNYRYLIFFDDGYAQYAPHAQTRLVCECSSLVWEEVHPYSREFVRGYLLAYPERPMVRLHAGQNLKAEWRGKWWSSKVVNVDASLVEVQFLRTDRREWIYRGSTRLAPLYLELQAAERHRPRALPRTQPQSRTNMPYVEYTRSEEQAANKQTPAVQQRQQQIQQNDEIRRQRAVAKKSTAEKVTPPPPPQQNASANLDNVTSRVVYYTPKNAVKPYKMTPHICSPKCKRLDVLALKDLRTYNPLAKPLLSGWERQIVRWKGHKDVMYVSPCGRRLRNMRELHRYLRTTESDMPVDLFDFSPSTHCLAEFVLNKCFVGKKDLSHGKENVPVPCVNYYDESLPEFCSYNTERTPTAGVPLNLDPEFLCGCDCEDDCEDKSKCACWKMTLEGARTIGYEGDVGYVYRRLPEPLPSGIYECNSRCKCKNTCLNRVAQHPLQLKLQVFKTLNRGWGIRALNDVPKGAFLCVYAGNLLTDATANLDGLNEGDEYLAELDYIEVVEQMKEGYEEDIPEKTKQGKVRMPKKNKETDKKVEDDEEEESSEEEDTTNKNEKEDGDFQPGYIGLGVPDFSKRLRRRDSKKEPEENKEKEAKKDSNPNPDEECITISDDEEVREPSCFTAAAGMGANEFISKYNSVRTLFGEDEACYIMDAKVQGNIGRYLNHSCTPNVFVQNVFVDTHDPRFPWVSFFALHHIRAGTELTWNYNYDVGSVPGKVLYCFCGTQNCRGRLL